MSDFFSSSTYFGVTVCIIGYALGVFLKKKLKWGLLNPLLISILFAILMIQIFGVDYENFSQSAKYLSYLLTPATVCLAVPLYQQLSILKQHFAAVFLGILAGVFSSLGSVLGMAALFGLNHTYYVTLLPKSITTAIGMGVSEELAGIPTITVAVIIVTGILGNVIGEQICRLFRIEEPVAVGLAFGTASHAIGTSKAMELGEIQGAMSSLSIAVSGLLTVIGASVFANFL
ncbi:LrgB family protein [Lachnospiraceae bacterium 46-15]